MVSVVEAQSAVLELSSKLGNQVPVDFVVRDTWTELYGYEANYGGGFHSAKNASERGFVTIAAGNHDSVDAIARTVQHEIVGHWMLNTYSGDQKIDLLTALVNSKDSESLKPVWDQVQSSYPELSKACQAEEVWAHIAESVDIDVAPVLSIDRIQIKSDSLAREDVVSIIQSRVQKLAAGQLSQQIFPETDVHQFVDDRLKARELADEWKRNNDIEPPPKKKSPNLSLV